MLARPWSLFVLLLVAISHCGSVVAAEGVAAAPAESTNALAAPTGTPMVGTNTLVTSTNLPSPPPDQTASRAEDFRRSWQVPPLGDDKFDWVQLKSGEWLKGEIKSLQGDKLSFDSDELELQEFKWKDVHKLISPHMNTVLIDDGKHKERALGSLWITRDKVIVDGEDTLSYPRHDLFGIVPGVPKEVNYWSGKLSFGLTLRGGNTEQVEYDARANLTRRTPSTRLSLDYLGNFSQTDGTETVNNQRASATFDVFVSRKLFVRIPFAEYYRDPFQNIAHRFTAGTGVGYDIYNRFNSPVVEWNVTLGPAYQQTWYDSVEPGEPQTTGGAAIVLGTRFNWDITSRIEVTLDSRGQVSVSGANSSTLHNELIWELELTKVLDLDVSFIWDYTASPQPDATGAVPKNSDYRLILALALDF